MIHIGITIFLTHSRKLAERHARTGRQIASLLGFLGAAEGHGKKKNPA